MIPIRIITLMFQCFLLIKSRFFLFILIIKKREFCVISLLCYRNIATVVRKRTLHFIFTVSNFSSRMKVPNYIKFNIFELD